MSDRNRTMTTRRRLVIAALATTGTATLGLGLRHRASQWLDWRGTALGADARILIAGPSATGVDSDRMIGECRAEIARLEQSFSLYLTSSEIVRLNADGMLREASPDLRALLHVAGALHSATGGLFDPTVQPLWQAYADWHGTHGDALAPPRALIAEARARIGFARLARDGRGVRLPDGGALTLNGIAQGYITDRIADLLRRRGYDHVLLDIGEVRAIGADPAGAPFRVTIAESGRRLSITNTALATSSAPSLMLSRVGGIGHILHPASGGTPLHWRCVTVRHASAAIADALSTALAIATPAETPGMLAAVSGASAWFDAT